MPFCFEDPPSARFETGSNVSSYTNLYFWQGGNEFVCILGCCLDTREMFIHSAVVVLHVNSVLQSAKSKKCYWSDLSCDVSELTKNTRLVCVCMSIMSIRPDYMDAHCPTHVFPHRLVTPVCVSCLCPYCPSVLMSRWNSWSCSSVSRPAWYAGSTESATESPRG